MNEKGKYFGLPKYVYIVVILNSIHSNYFSWMKILGMFGMNLTHVLVCMYVVSTLIHVFLTSRSKTKQYHGKVDSHGCLSGHTCTTFNTCIERILRETNKSTKTNARLKTEFQVLSSLFLSIAKCNEEMIRNAALHAESFP